MRNGDMDRYVEVWRHMGRVGPADDSPLRHGPQGDRLRMWFWNGRLDEKVFSPRSGITARNYMGRFKRGGT